MPNPISAALTWLGFGVETPSIPSPELTVAESIRRGRQADVSAERALTLVNVYRGIQIHATSACQTPLIAKRNGVKLDRLPAIVAKPDLAQSLESFIEYSITSLYVDGNAFWRILRNGSNQVVALEPLNPNEVSVQVTRDVYGVDTIAYQYRGKRYTSRDIKHLKLLRIPGLHRGLGPIQAAVMDVRGALDARDYGSMWLSDANMPDGVLTTDQVLGAGDADKYKNIWYGRNADGTAKAGENRNISERLRVLGQGLHYSPLLLKPSDVQFLETQQFSNVQLARLLGVPASLMLISIEGGSQVYANIEQDFIGYIRFSLRKPMLEIETALTEVLNDGTEIRFELDILTRPDTKTRFEGYAIGIEAGVITEDEARGEEGLPPLTAAQRAQIATRTPAPTLKVKS